MLRGRRFLALCCETRVETGAVAEMKPTTAMRVLKGLAVAAIGIAMTAGASVAQSSGKTKTERYIPTIWVDPDGCEHWVMDDGFEGFMTPHVTRDGKPVCRRGNVCGVMNSDQLFATDSARIGAAGQERLRQFFQQTNARGFVITGHTDSRASDAYNMNLVASAAPMRWPGSASRSARGSTVCGAMANASRGRRTRPPQVWRRIAVLKSCVFSEGPDMTLKSAFLSLCAVGLLAGCGEGGGGQVGENKSIDYGFGRKHLSQLQAGIWVDPNGCDHWIIDDGIEGYLSQRLDRNGKPVCSGRGTAHDSHRTIPGPPDRRRYLLRWSLQRL